MSVKTPKTLVWIHGDSISITDPALEQHPDSPALFVFDRPFLEKVPVAFPRLAFMYQGVRDIAAARTAPLEIRLGDALTELYSAAKAQNASQIAVSITTSSRFAAICTALEREFEVLYYQRDRLTRYDGKIKRFFGFWKVVEAEVMQGEGLFSSKHKHR